ncbi:hypothetical protein D0962_21275 [Leptolyngbyaceae cyanobacterium CCMR0082]|uniref:Uncharacterized protein n=1 Tax=Adonisia turfae CCMR0082 TaxID=2304604 RepID=A0A6M0SBB3_9CYAN|nr:hypothetical protein [Adonisia turfae CCMR0082]
MYISANFSGPDPPLDYHRGSYWILFAFYPNGFRDYSATEVFSIQLNQDRIVEALYPSSRTMEDLEQFRPLITESLNLVDYWHEIRDTYQGEPSQF